jgi:hypothetical protein
MLTGYYARKTIQLFRAVRRRLANRRRRVILESPYAGDRDIERNTAYAREALRDSLQRGEAPLASHLLYTQPGVLSDNIPIEREKGIAAGLAWLTVADAMVIYHDLDISPGMKAAIAEAEKLGVPIEMRSCRAPNK